MGSQCNKKLNIKLNILNAAASIYIYVPKKKKYLPPVRKVVALHNKTNRHTNTKPLHTIQTTSSPKLTVTAPFFNIIYIYIYI